jgi:hypothetical protein
VVRLCIRDAGALGRGEVESRAVIEGARGDRTLEEEIEW